MLRVFCMMNVWVVNVFGEHRDLFWICHPGLVRCHPGLVRCHPGLVPGSLSYVIRDPPDKRGMTMKEIAHSKSMALLPSKFSASVCIPVTLLPHPVMLSFEKDKPRANLVC